MADETLVSDERRMGSLLLEDRRYRSGRTGLRWRPAWIWPSCAEDLAREQLADAPGPSLHMCSGSSRLGDVRLDAFHPSADVRGDARRAPFEDATFGAVLMDPPWTIQDLRERHRFIAEAARVLRDEGVFLLYAPWMPQPSWGLLEGVWVRVQDHHRLPRAPVVFTRWRRKPRRPRDPRIEVA